MRVLHIQKAKGIGGSERHLLMLLPALRDAGVEVRMGVAATDGGELFADELRRQGIDTQVGPAGRDVSALFARWAWRQIRAFQPDVVHTHLIHANLHGLLGARLAGVASVSSEHGTPAFLRRQPMSAAGGVIGRMPTRTIAISNYVKSFLEEHRLRRPGTVRVVHYGLDSERWPATDDARDQARARLGLAPGDVAVAMTARLVPGKGHDALIDAVALARERAPTLRLVVAGDGPLRADLEAHAVDRLGSSGVVMTGFVDDVRPVVWASDVLAFPTTPQLGEGFGLSALEAMAAERPVVATDVGALPEVVEHGESGFVVPPGDVDALAAPLGQLALDERLRARMGSSGRARALSQFSIERMVAGTLAVYDEALGARRSRAA